MAADDFFKRWAKRKADSPPAAPGALVQPAVSAADEVRRSSGNFAGTQAKPLPTLEDVGNLTRESDYSPFVGKGIDEAVKRSAMKKLFSDPHFNTMDGLDIYIGDYNTFEPIPPEMLAALNHAKALLDPLSQFEKPVAALAETVKPPDGMAPDSNQTESGEQPTQAIETVSAQPDTASIASEGAQATPVPAEPVASAEPVSDPAASPINPAQVRQ